jgi:hypothetical protein
MRESKAARAPLSSGLRWLVLISACILFGVLMSSRDSFGAHWQRALVAACAFSLLGVMSFLFRRPRA